MTDLHKSGQMHSYQRGEKLHRAGHFLPHLRPKCIVVFTLAVRNFLFLAFPGENGQYAPQYFFPLLHGLFPRRGCQTYWRFQR